jgi:ribosomal protein S18 acetylase RimI-like enzyme
VSVKFNIERTRSIDHVLQDAIHSLLPQLSPEAALPTMSELEDLVESTCTTLFVARGDEPDGAIIGMVALVSYRIPSGRLSRIEDLIVKVDARGRGVGKALTEAAIAHAQSVGSKAVDLTSNPARSAANRLYQQLGFERGRTNVYRLWLDSDLSDEIGDR